LLIDSSKPQLLIVFSQGVPSPGTYGIDGVTVNVEYLLNPNVWYDGANGSVQVTSMSTSRAQGAFNFELQSPINNPTCFRPPRVRTTGRPSVVRRPRLRPWPCGSADGSAGRTSKRVGADRQTTIRYTHCEIALVFLDLGTNLYKFS